MGKNLGELKENMKKVIEMTLEPLPDNVVKSSAQVSKTITGESRQGFGKSGFSVIRKDESHNILQNL